jgi:hypothetical protein
MNVYSSYVVCTIVKIIYIVLHLYTYHPGYCTAEVGVCVCVCVCVYIYKKVYDYICTLSTYGYVSDLFHSLVNPTNLRRWQFYFETMSPEG